MPTKSTGPTSLFKLMKAIWADTEHPFTATELSESMTRLEAEGFIRQEAYKDVSRHWRKRYVLAEDSSVEDFLAKFSSAENSPEENSPAEVEQ